MELGRPGTRREPDLMLHAILKFSSQGSRAFSSFVG